MVFVSLRTDAFWHKELSRDSAHCSEYLWVLYPTRLDLVAYHDHSLALALVRRSQSLSNCNFKLRCEKQRSQSPPQPHLPNFQALRIAHGALVNRKNICKPVAILA